jgi:hypothetical protein
MPLNPLHIAEYKQTRFLKTMPQEEDSFPSFLRILEFGVSNFHVPVNEFSRMVY